MEVKLYLLVTVAMSEVFCKCRPKNVKLVNFRADIRRSIKTTIGVSAVKCPGLNDFYYSWEIKEFRGRGVFTSSQSTITIDGYKISSNVVFLKNYVAVANVSHYPDMSYHGYTASMFRFEPDEMHIEILGGSEKTHLVGKKIELNAKKLSRDTSYPPNEDAFAGNICKWTVTPKIENFLFPDSLILSIPIVYIRLNTEYKFTITVTRTKIPNKISTKEASQIIEVITDKAAEINIKCLRNCINPHPLEITVFGVECVKNCEYLNYKWSIKPAIDESKMDFGTGYDKLLVYENAYKAGDTIIVTVKSGNSRSSGSLQFMSGMTKGVCDIEPKEGISGVTAFKIKCAGFSSPYGTILYMIYQMTDDVEGGVLLNEDSYNEENEVYLTEGSPATVKINVQDDAFLQENILLSVQVNPYSPPGNMSKCEAIKRLVLNQESDSVVSSSFDGLNAEVVQMVSYLLNAIKECENMDNSTVKDLHKHMVESIMRTKFLRFKSSVQCVSVLKKLQKFKLKTDTTTSGLIGKSMALAAYMGHKMYNIKGIIPQGFLNEFFTSNLHLASELVKKIDEVANILSEPTPPHDYDSYDEYVSEKLHMMDDLMELITKVIISVQVNGLTIISKNLPDQREMYFESEMIHFATRRILLTSLALNQTIGLSNISNSKVYIPKPLIDELQLKRNDIDYQFGVFKQNPFWWHRHNQKFNTEFILFDFFHKNFKIKESKNSFYLHLQVSNVPRGKLEGNLTDEKISAHRIEIEPGTLLVAVFQPSNETYRVTSSECFCKAEDFSRGVTIGKGTNESERTLIVRPVKRKNIIYVCVMRSGPKLNYEANFAAFSCVYWDLKTGKWKTDGCRVQNAALQNDSLMVCKCSHVSLFVGKIFVAPNSLSLGTDIDFTIAFVENRLMIIIIGVLLTSWFTALILAHLKDKQMKKKNFIHVLDDNVPGDPNVYLIVVFTGVFYDAGTTADVAFQLIGDQAKSRIHLIRCQNVIMLKRNSQDWFILYTPFHLGDIKKIRIWHNSKGNKPHWYCARIIVQDMKTGHQYCFTVNKWFSVIWGSGKIYREIRIKEIDNKDRKMLFFTQFEHGIRDKHLWMSIIVRDTQSNFSSKERVSCAFCVVFLSMLATAMFFGIPLGIPSDSIDEVSSFDITRLNIVIFIESWLVASPIGMLIVFLFKNSAPSSPKRKRV